MSADLHPPAFDTLERTALAELAAARSDPAALEAWRVRYLARHGLVASAMSRLGLLPAAERPAAGARANRLKRELETAYAAAQRELQAGGAAFESVDVTLPGSPVPVGHAHPISQIIDEACGIFTSMGFQVAEGPEVEWDYYNFEALNMPRHHPARDAHDTFWITPDPMEHPRPILLRTHTSPVQIRVMEQVKPPLRIIAPGRVYRYEATDATHESQFHQIEGFAVGRHITFADLKGTLMEFARRMFGRERRVRFRCDFFPYVEPGVDMAIDLNGRWLEILGAGMIHPAVLERVGIDPAQYTGFAFGMGPERLAMLRYGIEDMRLFHGNDLRFLRQF